MEDSYTTPLTSILIFAGVIIVLLSVTLMSSVYAHFEHFTHYNNGGDELGKYYVYEAIQPQYTRPGEPSEIMFSVQDTNGNDVKTVNVLVEIYSGITGERIKIYPWTVYPTGDFEVYYTFPEIGPYQVVISISNLENFKSNDIPRLDPQRSTLSSTSDCSCDRAVFNIAISRNFGSIYNLTLLIAISIPILILGTILVLKYRRRSQEKNNRNLPKNEILRYTIMLLAISGGLIHFAIYSEHASLRLQYSIFLITAGAAQVVYGVLFILLTLRQESIRNTSRDQSSYYQKSFILNLFGLIGSMILIGLYAYTLVFPPPISPNASPEGIELAGILAKSTEILVVLGIAYIIYVDRKIFRSQSVSIN